MATSCFFTIQTESCHFGNNLITQHRELLYFQWVTPFIGAAKADIEIDRNNGNGTGVGD
jgi:hypothetical protein